MSTIIYISIYLSLSLYISLSICISLSLSIYIYIYIYIHNHRLKTAASRPRSPPGSPSRSSRTRRKYIQYEYRVLLKTVQYTLWIIRICNCILENCTVSDSEYYCMCGNTYNNHGCYILPFRPSLWNTYFPPEPANTAKHSPKSISEGGRIWQVWIEQKFLNFPFVVWLSCVVVGFPPNNKNIQQ